MLSALGGLIWSAARSYDVAGRYGGEEFLVLAPGTSRREILNVAERIRTQVKSAFEKTETPVTVSLGVVVREPGDRCVDEILRRADDGLYRVKRAGRDRIGELDAPP